MLSSNGLTNSELERIRLALSVFQDGTGWETIRKPDKQGGNKVYYAGFRQFERIVADVFGGIAPENKGVFDVFVPIKNTDMYYGVSCKMRSELNKALKIDGRVYIEMSNAAGEFMERVIADVGNNFLKKPAKVGKTILTLITEWHKNASKNSGYKINLDESSFLVLLYNKKLEFSLYQYELSLPRSDAFIWSFPPPKQSSKRDSRRLVGYLNGSLAFEWYLYSGGQFKYYPLAQNAKWHSGIFGLEPLPKNIKSGILARAKEYFPEKWK
jgi:hypothetical protein